jgi:hypothetical protein
LQTELEVAPHGVTLVPGYSNASELTRSHFFPFRGGPSLRNGRNYAQISAGWTQPHRTAYYSLMQDRPKLKTVENRIGAVAGVLLLRSIYAWADLSTADTAYSKGYYSSAAQEYRVLAEKGDRTAQWKLGRLYSQGKGVPRKAAAQGLPVAKSNIGLLYDKGWGVAKDPSQAVEWLRKAADQGFAEAQCDLGVHYATGAGIARNPAEAAKWFQKAANQGHCSCQYNLGIAYSTGDGIERDDYKAYFWLVLAAANRNPEAVLHRDSIND